MFEIYRITKVEDLGDCVKYFTEKDYISGHYPKWGEEIDLVTVGNYVEVEIFRKYIQPCFFSKEYVESRRKDAIKTK